MSNAERAPIEDVATLSEQDERDMVHGYWRGYRGGEEPGIEFNRAFWHGWRNGMMDGKHMQNDAASANLAHECVTSGYLGKLRARGGG